MKTRQTYTEWLITSLIQIVTAAVMFTLCIAVMVVFRGNKLVKDLESNLVVQPYVDDYEEYSIYTERIPVKEQMSRYINNIPIKEAEFPELLEEEPENVALIAEKQENINVIKETANNELAYNLSDKELLAQMMYAEEGVFFRQYEENPEKVELVHKLAGSVVLHRLENHYMGAQSLPDVLYAEHQYDSRTVQKVEQGQKMPEIVYTWAEDLLQNGPIGPDNMLFQAEFEQGSETYDHIGNQYFCLQ